MKLALAQMKMAEDIEHNLFKTLGLIREAGAHGADLILFPEIQLTPFFPQYQGVDVSNYVLREEDEAVHAVREACRSSRIFAAPNFYLRYDGKQYDTSLLIDRGGQIVGHQKMVHVAQCPCFYEQDYYTPSDEGFQVFDTELGELGIVVCFDRHYPESIRTEALHCTPPRLNGENLAESLDAAVTVQYNGEETLTEELHASDFESVYAQLNRLFSKCHHREKAFFGLKGRVRFFNSPSMVGLFLLTISHSFVRGLVSRAWRIEKILHYLQTGYGNKPCKGFADKKVLTRGPSCAINILS